MTQLTDDEYTVAMIVAEGASLAPIGRWEKPIKDMHARGLLDKNDDVNYVVNDKTRAAIAGHEQVIDGALRTAIESNNKIANASTQAQQSIRQAALHLSFAAKASMLATGESAEDVIRKWLPAVAQKALELVNE